MLDSMTPQEEEAVKSESRQRCVDDLHYLAKHVLGYNRLTDHYHADMARDIDTPRYRFKLLMHPRGHFKSTIGTEAYSVQNLIRSPNERILLTNVKLDNARKFLRTVAHHFNSNNRFRWIWRDWWIKNYATDLDKEAMKSKLDWVTRDVQDELTLLRPYAGREASITTGAVDASMVSQHYSLIIADDLINREYVRTQEMVEKSILYFKDLLDLLDADGRMMVIGTHWSHMDLYHWIINEFGHKATFSVPRDIADGRLKDIMETSEKDKSEKEWLVSITPTTIANPVFPEEYDAKVLQGLLEAKGPYEFGCQYLLDPTPTEHQKFKEEWLRTIDVLPEDKIAQMDVCITVDPAISTSDEADNSAVVVCGYDENNRMYLLDGLNEKLTEDELPEALFSMAREWTRRARFVLPVGFEAVGFQQLYIYNLERMMLERDFFFAIEPIKRGNASKDERILRLVPRLKNGFYMPRKILKDSYSGREAPYDLVQRLKWELLKFPFAGKKDLADTMADQLEIVKAHRLPQEDSPGSSEPKRDFTHSSVLEDKRRDRRQRASQYSDAVRSI